MRCALGFWWVSVMVASEQSCPQGECDASPLLQLSHQVGILANATKSPLQVGEACDSDGDCESGVCALTWFGYVARLYQTTTVEPGLSNKACQLKLSGFNIVLRQKKRIAVSAKATQKYLPVLRQAVNAWKSVIRGLAMLVRGAPKKLVIEYAFVGPKVFGKKYCGCNNNCCKSLTGSSGPTLLYQADPNSGLRGLVTKAEIVFTTTRLGKYYGTSYLESLLLREVGVCLGIGSIWDYLGMVYKEPSGSINTLTNLYGNSGEMIGGWEWTGQITGHGVLEVEKDTRNMPLLQPFPACIGCGYAEDVMKIRLETQKTIGAPSVGLLHSLGYTIDYENANLPFGNEIPCAGCSAQPKLLKPNMKVKNQKGKTITTVRGFPYSSSLLAESVEGSPDDRSKSEDEDQADEDEADEDEDSTEVLLTEDADEASIEQDSRERVEDAVQSDPAGNSCSQDSDCLSGVCVTSMVGYLKSAGYRLGQQDITGFSSKMCKPKLHDFDVELIPLSSNYPEYAFIFEEARTKWLSVIKGLSRAIRFVDGPITLQIYFDYFFENSRTLGSAGPSNVYKVDGVDGGSYWIPAIGTMNFNARFLVDNLISLELFKVVVLHEMAHVLLIGFWDLLSTAAQCDLTDFFTDAYLDGGGKAAMAHYILSEQWKKARKTPLQLYRTPGLAEPGSDCGHWDEDTVDNELMSPVINVDSNPLSILTAGGLEDMGYTIDYKECEVWPDSNTDSSVYTFFPGNNNAVLDGGKVKKKQRKLTDLVDYELKRPDLKFLDGPKGKVITTLPGELTPAQVLKTKKDLQEFLKKKYPLPEKMIKK
ncbi:unnamed protein product [Durusdinium trenchii]|uniref:Uncharacterized protein n=1 Tax=Durusdinium trenchii TaxID=1381693 RepID=A0ABP0N5P9_9DINO